MLKFNRKIKISKRNVLSIIFSVVVVVMLITCSIFFSINSDFSNAQNNVISFSTSDENKTEKLETTLKEENEDKVKTSTPKNSATENNDAFESSPAIQLEDNSDTVEYSRLYPNLYCTRPKTQITPGKTIFLTFDDGPSDRTPEVLEILRQKEVKATFFVTGSAGKKGQELIKQIVAEGHAIGVHTYTHEFRQIYSSIPAFLDDFNKIYNLIYKTTDVKPEIFRFPGGSNTTFNKDIRSELLAEMKRRGFDYFDWNLSVGDAVSRTPTPTQKCINNVLNFSKNYDCGVVLMHDSQPKKTTVAALPAIIDGLRAQGFSFDKLSHNINPTPYSLTKYT